MKVKKILSLLISAILIFSVISGAAANNNAVAEEVLTQAPDVYDVISDGIGSAQLYLQNQLTNQHNDGGVGYGFEWYIISMLRTQKTVDEEILDEYYSSVAQKVKEFDVNTKPTDLIRTALAMLVMDKDITNIEGVNLLELIYNNEKLQEGSNELAYALIAFSTTDIEIPENAKWDKNKIITELLKFVCEDGGFGLYDNTSSDVDMTAICIQALAPYIEDSNVEDIVYGAVDYLKSKISEEFTCSDNANSTAQVLLALASLKLDVTDSENGFGSDEENIITALSKYRNPDGSGYLHGDVVDSMATVQVMQAYDAYRKAHKEDVLYWDFSAVGNVYDDEIPENDTTSDEDAVQEADIYVTIVSDGNIVENKNGEYVAQSKVTVTDINKDGKLSVDEALYAAHEEHYEGGAQEGYSSFVGAYGLSLSVLWGKGTENTTASAGYYLNNVSCWSLEDTVEEGDYLTAFNYYDASYYSDAYSYFSENEVSAAQGDSVTLTLNYLGYDEEFNTVVFPCSNAEVVFLGSNNASVKILTTDEEGKVKIKFKNTAETGSYYVMAYKDDKTIVPTICKITLVADNGNSGGSISKKITVYIKVADPKGTTYLKKTSYSVEKGTTVIELLEKTGLDIKTESNVYGVYVKEIEGLAELDKGDKSGWMYRVDGTFPNHSASLYPLSSGDYVEWLYTRDLGNDLKNTHTSSSSSSGIIKPNNKKEEADKEETSSTEKTPFSENTFKDVKNDDWYYNAVKYAYENNLMNGTDKGFEPESKMTRAMLVTVLYRMAKGETTSNNHSFTDVSLEEWYSDAVMWAAEKGIVNGISKTKFAPDSNVTREQMALIIYRFAKSQGYDIISETDISSYADASDVSVWALDAIKWANKSTLINGTSETTLLPKDTATRAQVATILMRFCETIAK